VLFATCRQTQWDAPAWDVAGEDEDDMDLGTPTYSDTWVRILSVDC